MENQQIESSQTYVNTPRKSLEDIQDEESIKIGYKSFNDFLLDEHTDYSEEEIVLAALQLFHDQEIKALKEEMHKLNEENKSFIKILEQFAKSSPMELVSLQIKLKKCINGK